MASQYQYEDEVCNNYLGKRKTIRARTLEELKYKKREQLSKWSDLENKQRIKATNENIAKKAEADTDKAINRLHCFKEILKESLLENHKINFKNYLKNSKFKEHNYVKKEVKLQDIYTELNVPKKSFWEFLFRSIEERRKAKEVEALKIWNHRTDLLNHEYILKIKEYERDKSKFEDLQRQHNLDINQWEKGYHNKEKNSVERYVNEVLNKSMLSCKLKKEFVIEYDNTESRLIILYKLPKSTDIPNVVEYKYVKTKNEVTTKTMKKDDFEKFYDDIIFQIALRILHEVFDSSTEDCIRTVVFNGWVEYVDEATGKDATSCIISLMVNRDEFEKLDLSRVVYKECIKNLKGIFAGRMISRIPVTPMLSMNKKDKRFIENKEIIAKMNDGTNLASMPWEDFEYLVRELFEHKFKQRGGEVKITQASRDGGVDAVVFDPDPFNGGKFIIQAKRYNNVVPVSATRDLYGTVMHEHAIRGILVTTSTYGNDSYEFIKDKPITLINGSELLGLFNEIGRSNLRINLWEDRKKI